MKEYKFDRFYYIVDESTEHYLPEISELEVEEYNLRYKGKMLCPLCKQVQLTRVRSSTGTYLRTYPKIGHGMVKEKLCVYQCETATKREVESFFKELRNKRKISSRLDAILRILLGVKISTVKKDNGVDDFNDPLAIVKKTKNNGDVRKIIPHYSFYSWGPNIPQDDVLMIIYGKIQIKLVAVKSKKELGGDKEEAQTESKEFENSERDENTSIYIHFHDIKNGKFITSCRKPYNLNLQEGKYAVAVLGKCVKRGNYYNLWVNAPMLESMKFLPIS